jgi:hypothetical protein
MHHMRHSANNYQSVIMYMYRLTYKFDPEKAAAKMDLIVLSGLRNAYNT